MYCQPFCVPARGLSIQAASQAARTQNAERRTQNAERRTQKSAPEGGSGQLFEQCLRLIRTLLLQLLQRLLATGGVDGHGIKEITQLLRG